MDYGDMAEIALSMPGVEELFHRGSPSIMRDGQWMFNPKKGGDPIVVKLDWDSHDRLLAEHPDVFYKTPHYEGYPAILVRTLNLNPVVAREVIEASYNDAPNKAKAVKKS